MPMKLTLGLCKKLGLPDYGSLGATCHLELELDQMLLQQDLAAFHQQVQDAYTACRQAVQDELARERPQQTVAQCAAAQSGSTPEATTGANHQPGSHSNGNGNSNGPYAASEKQLSYINQLARQIKGLGARRLEALAEQMYGKTPAELTSLEASALIDQLKAIKSGELNLEGLFAGAAA